MDEASKDRPQNGERDPLGQLRARLDAAIDELRPKIRNAFEELDARVDAALTEIRPRAKSAIGEVGPKVDEFVSEMQPKLDSLLQRLQLRIDELRTDLEERAARSAQREGGKPVGEIGPGESGTDEDTDDLSGGAGI